VRIVGGVRSAMSGHADIAPNRVGGKISLPPPTPPGKQVRTRRFRLA
jgi:hypothetical protein